METLGIIAGQGQLPVLLMEACRARQQPFFVLAYHGQTPPEVVTGVDHLWLSLGELGKGLDALKTRHISKVVLAGKLRRPSLTELKTDWRGARFLARLGMGALGDNTLLLLILEELSKEGLTVVGIHELLTSLQYPEGPLGDKVPTPQAQADIRLGVQVLKTLSPLDIGQAVVIQQGVVLGIEAAEGTDRLILRCADLQKPGEPAVLVKMAKAHQDERVDLPTLGPQTLALLIQAAMAGLAFEASKTLLIGANTLREEANKHGLFLLGIAMPQDGEDKRLC
jgi:UDP-2,3-diacylglucosamine hydrolase